MPAGELEKLITIVGRLSEMGSRSAMRIVVHLLKQKNCNEFFITVFG